MPTLELQEPTFHCEIVSTSAISVLGEAVPAFLRAVHTLSAPLHPELIEVASTGGTSFSYTLELEDGRSYTAVLNTVGRTRAIETSAFTLTELLLHNPIIELIFDLLARSATSIEVNWS